MDNISNTVTIEIASLSQLDRFSVQFGNSAYNVKKKYFRKNDGHSVFYGENIDADGDLMISVLGTDIQGTLHKDGKTYSIRTTPDMEYIVTEVEYPQNERDTKLKIYDDDVSISLKKMAASSNCNKIRVLVAYTGAAANLVSNIYNTVLLAIEESNQSFRNSGIDYELELACVRKTDYTEYSMSTDLNRFSSNNDGYMDEIHSLRDNLSADICVLLFKEPSGGWCGEAKGINVNADNAFCVVNLTCATGYYSFVHEIGHLVGCRHNVAQDPTNYPYQYGHGYVSSNNTWRTIMSYGSSPRICYWSNPNVSYGQGEAKEAMGTTTYENNARVWNERGGGGCRIQKCTYNNHIECPQSARYLLYRICCDQWDNCRKPDCSQWNNAFVSDKFSQYR